MVEPKCPFCDCPVETNDDNVILFCFGCELGVGSYAIYEEENL